MNIRLQYSLTPEDYHAYNRAYLANRRSLTPRTQRGLRSPLFPIRLFFIVILSGFVGTMIFLQGSDPPAAAPPAGAAPVSLGDALFAFLPYLVLFIVFIVSLVWLRRSGMLFRRLAPQVIKIGEVRQMEITPEHVLLREPGMVCDMQWSYFMRFIETPTIFVLFVMPRVGHIIPKRGFATEAELDEFRRFAQAHVGNQPVGFPVQGVTMPGAPPVQPAQVLQHGKESP